MGIITNEFFKLLKFSIETIPQNQENYYINGKNMLTSWQFLLANTNIRLGVLIE